MKFTKEHEWLTIEGDISTVGITDHAAELLGDIVYLDLPSVGDFVSVGDDVAVVESVKAASDIYSPMSGEIIEVNEELADTPELINENAKTAWIFKIKCNNISESDEYMSEEEYNSFI